MLEVDQIYHLASPASPEGYMRHPIETHLVNSVGTLNLLRLAPQKNARFLYTSTSEAYGDPEVHPQVETYRGNVNPIGPRSCYDESKRFGESITMEFVRQFDLDARIVRIFNTYGPRNDPLDGRVVPNFIMRALHSSRCRSSATEARPDRSATYRIWYKDCGRHGHRRGARRGHQSRKPRRADHHGPRQDHRSRLCDSDAGFEYLPERPDDPYKRCPDITKAINLLGWRPAVDIETGMRETIDYFRPM